MCLPGSTTRPVPACPVSRTGQIAMECSQPGIFRGWCSAETHWPLWRVSFPTPHSRQEQTGIPMVKLDRYDLQILKTLATQGRITKSDQIGRASCRERVCPYE